MGCGLSKEDAEGGAVSRCRERKHLLSAAVQARHAMAGAHAGHAAALKNVGAALSDYAAGETDRHDAVVMPRSASAAAALAAAAPATVVKALPSPLDAVLPPPPPPPGAGDGGGGPAAPLHRSMSAPDIQPIRKGRSGEAPIMEEEEGEGGDAPGDDAGRRREDDDPPPPPPPPPANVPPPSRSPPPVPAAAEANRERATAAGDSWNDFFFGSPDAMPAPPPTLDPSASAAAESSWAAERRMPAPPPPPPESDQQPPKQPQPVPSAEEIAEGKKPAAELVTHRAATQKAARKTEGKKSRVVTVPPQTARLGDVLRKLDDHFLKASQSAHEVSKLLEAARMHYHSNFAETRGTFHSCSAPSPVRLDYRKDESFFKFL